MTTTKDQESNPKLIEIQFETRATPSGRTVTLTTPTRKQTKRFRNGYASAEASAKKWIGEQMQSYKDFKSERKTEGIEKPDIVFFVNGVRQQ